MKSSTLTLAECFSPSGKLPSTPECVPSAQTGAVCTWRCIGWCKHHQKYCRSFQLPASQKFPLAFLPWHTARVLSCLPLSRAVFWVPVPLTSEPEVGREDNLILWFAQYILHACFSHSSVHLSIHKYNREGGRRGWVILGVGFLREEWTVCCCSSAGFLGGKYAGAKW